MTRDSQPFRRKLGKRLKDLRKQRRMTQSDLTNEARISFKYYQRIEGSNPPGLKLDTLQKITKVFDISIKDFFSFDTLNDPASDSHE